MNPLSLLTQVVGEPVDTEFFRPIAWTAKDNSMTSNNATTSITTTTTTTTTTSTTKEETTIQSKPEDDMSLLQTLIQKMTMTVSQGKDEFLSLVDLKRTSLENSPTPHYPTIFLFVGKWEDRKGIKTLLKAYYTTFTRDDNVLLVLLTNAYHSTDQVLTHPIDSNTPTNTPYR